MDRAKILYNFLEKHINIEEIHNILDYGGNGSIIPKEFEKANKFSFDISGVNSTKDVTNISDIESLKNYEWDLIQCCHVLEHVSDPLSLIENMLSYIKKGKYLYIELPYEDYLRKKLPFKAVLKRIIKTPQHLFKNIHSIRHNTLFMHEHINFFRPKTIHTIFKKKNVEIIENSIHKLENIAGQNAAMKILIRKK